MGGSGNNNGWPSDGGSPDDLPDLPEEWGVIVIPDDLAELADEVRAVRAELALTQPRTRWQRFRARHRMSRFGSAGTHAPVLIIAMALLVTLASLFASAWPGPARTPATQRTTSAAPADRSDTLPALELVGSDGGTVALRGHLPAVVLITDKCDCAKLISDTIAAVRPEVAVLAVSTGAPTTGTTPPTGPTAPTGAAAPQAQGKVVRVLNDPTGSLRQHLELGPPDGTAAALLVDRGGEIVREVLRTASVDDFRADLARI